MTARLTGKTALVTGSTSNIGKAIATAFAAEGAHVIVSGRDAGRGAAVVEAIRNDGGEADFIAADLDGSPDASSDLASQARDTFGRTPDILVNNAGIYPPHDTTSTDSGTFDRIFAVNVKAPFFLTASLAPEMAERGTGSIINLGSWITRLGIPVAPVYSASKAAMETLTRSWSAEFGSAGLRVNAISPGVVHEVPDDPDEVTPGDALMAGTPAGTYGTPDAIALAAVYLASDESRFVNGTVIDVDGGRVGVAVAAT